MKAARPLALFAACLFAGAALAQAPRERAVSQAAESRSAAALQGVIDCRAQSDPAARLACYDAAVQRLQQAEAAGEVVVVDRSVVREARRQVFGFTVPAIDLFGGRAAQRPEDQVDTVDDVVASVRFDANGKRIITLQGGAVWRQYSAEDVRVRSGSRVHIRRGLVGSYFMRVDNQPGFRVQRVQ